MDFALSERQTYSRDRVRRFIAENIRPRHGEYHEQAAAGERWKVLPVIEELKAEARARGLWNLFMPPSTQDLVAPRCRVARERLTIHRPRK